MSLYNIVGTSSLQAGQPEDVSQVLANFQAIQTILNGGIDDNNVRTTAAIQGTKLNIPNNIRQLLRGDGTWGSLGNVTVSTMAGGPPGAPVDGDIWIATAVDGGGLNWQFRYNAGSASPYKWEFIGGAPYYRQQNTGNSYGSGTWNNLGWGLLTPRAGDYICTMTLTGQNTSGVADTYEVGIGVGSTTTVNRTAGLSTIGSALDYSLSATDIILAVAANTQLWVNGLSTSGASAAPSSAPFTAIPVRVS